MRRALPAGVFVVAALAFFVATKRSAVSWNEYSRLASVESLVERGTFKIGRSALGQRTRDKVLIDGSFYADKPPLLQLAAAAPYAALHAAGLRLAPDACPGTGCAYRPLTFLVVGLPAAVMLALFSAFARDRTGSVPWAIGLTLILGACTLALPYSLVFNNHMPTAVALVAAYALVPAQPSGADGPRLFAAGALAGAAFGFELLAALPILALAGLVAWRSRRGVLAFAAGGVLVTAVSVAADLATWGHVLPPYFATHGYRYAGSPYGDHVAGLKDSGDPWLNLVEGTLGSQGVVAHSPALLLAVVALVQVLRARAHPYRHHARAAAVGALAFAACVFLMTRAHGGQSFGNRHFLAILPLLFFFLALVPSPRTALGYAAVGLLALIGLVSASRGAREPWRAIPPPLYVDVLEDPARPRLCAGLVSACWPAGGVAPP